MKITRRFVAFLIALVAPLLFSSAQTSEKAAAQSQYLAYVGTYTAKTTSKGIYAFRFDTGTGKLTALGVAAETPDPSWVVVDPSGKYAYAVNETGQASTVSAFTVDRKSAKLTLLDQMPALGEDPCYLSFDKTGKYLLVANYSSGTVAVFPILADGRLGEHTALVKDQGASGPNKERQEAPHAHWIAAPGFVYVADLGLDRVLEYRFDAGTGTLAPGPRSLVLSPGTGPRHVAFDRHHSYWYVLGELQSTVTVFAPKAHRGFAQVQQISTLPQGFAGRNDAAEIAIHPNGKFLYTSNRGHDSIAIFAIDPGKGTLTLVALVPTGGKEPRHFAIDPSGKYLLAENQYSNNIVVFEIAPASGLIRQTGQTFDVPSPVDLTFVPALVAR